MADYHNGALILDAAKATLAQYLEQWLEESMRDKLAPRTFANYRLQVRRHIVPTSGNVKLKDLKPAHVQRLHRQMLGSGFSPASVRYAHAVLRRA